jgi:hypothetical protein
VSLDSVVASERLQDGLDMQNIYGMKSSSAAVGPGAVRLLRRLFFPIAECANSRQAHEWDTMLSAPICSSQPYRH